MEKKLVQVADQILVVEEAKAQKIRDNNNGGTYSTPTTSVRHATTIETADHIIAQEDEVGLIYQAMVSKAIEDATQSVTHNLKDIAIQALGFDTRWSKWELKSGDEHPISRIVMRHVKDAVERIIAEKAEKIEKIVTVACEKHLDSYIQKKLEWNLERAIGDKAHKLLEAKSQEITEAAFKAEEERLNKIVSERMSRIVRNSVLGTDSWGRQSEFGKAIAKHMDKGASNATD